MSDYTYFPFVLLFKMVLDTFNFHFVTVSRPVQTNMLDKHTDPQRSHYIWNSFKVSRAILHSELRCDPVMETMAALSSWKRSHFLNLLAKACKVSLPSCWDLVVQKCQMLLHTDTFPELKLAAELQQRQAEGNNGVMADLFWGVVKCEEQRYD